MEKRSAEEHRLLLVAAASLLCAALALACSRPPLARSVEPPTASESVVVTTHAPRAVPTQVVAHAAPEVQTEPLEESEARSAEPESYDAVFSEVEVERYEEKETGVSVGPMALYSALVLQKVPSYEAWRSAFDAQQPARQKAGFVAQAVLRGAFDNKLVAVWLAVTDPVLARSYLSATKPAAKSGKPRTQLARNLASRLESAGVGLHAALVTLEIEDLPAFQSAFDADAERRVALGIVGYALTQDLDDEARVYLYLQSEDPARLKAYLASKETRRIWHEAGVLAQKNPTILREISLSSMY